MLAFHRALYLDERARMVADPAADLWTRHELEQALVADVQRVLDGSGQRVLLAERDGRSVGYITGHIEKLGGEPAWSRGVVEDWFVDPTERGRGTGARLLEALLKTFDEEGCHVVESTTLPTNGRAGSLYERFGFRGVEVKFRKRLR